MHTVENEFITLILLALQVWQPVEGLPEYTMVAVDIESLVDNPNAPLRICTLWKYSVSYARSRG